MNVQMLQPAPKNTMEITTHSNNVDANSFKEKLVGVLNNKNQDGAIDDQAAVPGEATISDLDGEAVIEELINMDIEQAIQQLNQLLSELQPNEDIAPLLTDIVQILSTIQMSAELQHLDGETMTALNTQLAALVENHSQVGLTDMINKVDDPAILRQNEHIKSSLQLLMNVLEAMKMNAGMKSTTDESLLNDDVLAKLQQLVANVAGKATTDSSNKQNETTSNNRLFVNAQPLLIGPNRQPVVRSSTHQATTNNVAESELLLAGMTVKQPVDIITSPVIATDVPQGPMDKIQQYVLFVDQPTKQVNQEQFIKDFQNILAKSNLSFLNGNKSLQIKLFPEHLGTLRIELLQSEAGMLAKIITSSTAAKDLVESQLHSLRQSFQAQNIQVDKLIIANQQEQQFERFLNRDSNDRQGGQQKQEDDSNDNEHNEQAISFEEELLNLQV
ncbi:flagellar hook-length control protein FliK [Cytobacillus sp. IB215665]|uniref:flagellar hook-length control protein FliK n=1 Tax=Cytobacillus sp. IB215665 TaxID=3097357 RepID=UPI002A1465AA|nr:flagellar hook-length control protein FliK [Cytobacillus sp. IB215665]MDX8365067.1 flagellar hook-length control protein FliK [Cytobacillus sp. IB215665]